MVGVELKISRKKDTIRVWIKNHKIKRSVEHVMKHIFNINPDYRFVSFSFKAKTKEVNA